MHARPSTRTRLPALVLSLILSVAAGPAETMAEAFRAAPCEADPAPVTGVTGVTCGHLRVPRSRAPGAEPGWLDLPVARFEGGDGPPLLYLNGGPGGSVRSGGGQGLASWSELAGAFAQAGTGDLILMSQRGTDDASADHLRCPELVAYRQALLTDRSLADQREQRSGLQRAIITCRTRAQDHGLDLTAYSVDETVSDILALKQALGIDRWVVYGVSFGGRLALELARRDRAGIAALILDSPDPPGTDTVLHRARNLDRALARVAALCRDDRACRRATPRLKAAIDRLAMRLAREPVRTTVYLADRDTTVTVTLTATALIEAISYTLSHRGTIARLPYAVAAALDESFELLGELAARTAVDSGSVVFGTAASVDCQTFGPGRVARALERDGADLPAYGPFVRSAAGRARAICDIWLPDQTTPPPPTPVVTDVPALILAGELDPATPLEAADFLAGRLTRAVAMRYRYAAHGVLGQSQCAWADVAAFLRGDTVASDCDREAERLRFWGPLTR